MNNNFEIQSAISDTGEVRLALELTDDAYSTLKQLAESPAWKLYRQILINAKTEFFNAVLPIDDPNKIIKQVGMVAGINFGINQLPVLVTQYEDRIAKAQKAAETKDKRPAFVRQ